LGLFIRIGEKQPRLHTEKLSRNQQLQENMESCQNHFFSARAPPFFPNPVSSGAHLRLFWQEQNINFPPTITEQNIAHGSGGNKKLPLGQLFATVFARA